MVVGSKVVQNMGSEMDPEGAGDGGRPYRTVRTSRGQRVLVWVQKVQEMVGSKMAPEGLGGDGG